MATFIGDENMVRAFVNDLQALLKKHNVWMIAEIDCDNRPVIEFRCESNINTPEDSECLWNFDTYDLWPKLEESV